MTEKKPKILVYGAGSIGTYLGAKLYDAGCDVKLLGGKKLDGVGKFVLINGDTFEVPPKIKDLTKNEIYDIIFVTTKLYGAKAAMEEIKKNNLNSKITVFIQNGLVNDGFYDEIKGCGELVTISIFEGYRITGNQLAAGKSDLGWQMDQGVAGAKVSELLNSVGINSAVNPEISRMRAEKMLTNCAVSALSALNNKTLGELSLDEENRKIMEGIIDEGYGVLKDEYGLTDINEFKKVFYEIINQNKAHYSSLHQDIESGRETEIDFLNGLIVRKGKKSGIPTPLNQEIYTRIKEITEHREAMKERANYLKMK